MKHYQLNCPTRYRWMGYNCKGCKFSEVLLGRLLRLSPRSAVHIHRKARARFTTARFALNAHVYEEMKSQSLAERAVSRYETVRAKGDDIRDRLQQASIELGEVGLESYLALSGYAAYICRRLARRRRKHVVGEAGRIELLGLLDKFPRRSGMRDMAGRNTNARAEGVKRSAKRTRHTGRIGRRKERILWRETLV